VPAWLLRKDLLAAIAAGSALLFVLGAVAVPLFLARVRTDYFVHQRPAPLALRVAKNGLGALLLLAGIAMLVLPGQGILTMLVGLMLLDVPGKHALLRRLLTAPRVRRSIDALRRRAGRPPLELGDDR